MRRQLGSVYLHVFVSVYPFASIYLLIAIVYLFASIIYLSICMRLCIASVYLRLSTTASVSIWPGLSVGRSTYLDKRKTLDGFVDFPIAR